MRACVMCRIWVGRQAFSHRAEDGRCYLFSDAERTYTPPVPCRAHKCTPPL